MSIYTEEYLKKKLTEKLNAVHVVSKHTEEKVEQMNKK